MERKSALFHELPTFSENQKNQENAKESDDFIKICTFSPRAENDSISLGFYR